MNGNECGNDCGTEEQTVREPLLRTPTYQGDETLLYIDDMSFDGECSGTVEKRYENAHEAPPRYYDVTGWEVVGVDTRDLDADVDEMHVPVDSDEPIDPDAKTAYEEMMYDYAISGDWVDNPTIRGWREGDEDCERKLLVELTDWAGGVATYEFQLENERRGDA